jgi:hypothetical protein
MQMKKLFPALLVLAVALAAFWIIFAAESTSEDTAQGMLANGGSFDVAAPVDTRLAALEQAVRTERQARHLLQEEVFFLTEELERLSAENTAPEFAAESSNPAQVSNVTRGNLRGRSAPENRVARLVAGGFTEGEADWIVRRESELQMASLQARYDADRNGTPQDYFQNRQASSIALREELGDADYERYLESNGRSTRVAISTVLESSPAKMAGLQTGDEIINYDGRRVFSMSDLNRETLQGQAGQNVVIDFMREGIQMQVAIARGPVGIMGGRRYR